MFLGKRSDFSNTKSTMVEHHNATCFDDPSIKMMKISTLAVAAAIAIATVSAADQPALRSADMPENAAPGTVTTPDGSKKEMWGGGPWGGLGWGGGWGGLGWGGGWGGGWGRGFGWGW